MYRPADSGGKKIPILIPYSPYGKGGSGANLMDVVPYRVGVPKSRQSGHARIVSAQIWSSRIDSGRKAFLNPKKIADKCFHVVSETNMLDTATSTRLKMIS